MGTKQTETIGKHYVAAELAHRDWAPALTRDGLERTDILAVFTESDNRRMIEIRIRTALRTQPHNAGWPLGIKAQGPSQREREYFVMVAVSRDPEIPPRYSVAPRSHAATAAWTEHMNWLIDPEAEPGKRNTPVEYARVKLQTFKLYEDRWDLIFIDEHDAPMLFPPNYRVSAQTERVGLPPGHAWHTSLPDW